VAVLIDPPGWRARSRRWSHLASDTSLAELHSFAAVLGLPARGFEGDHYDVPEERYAAAVAAGAIPVSSRELLRRLQASGLRRPKRRGERVLASRFDPASGDRIDVLLSAKPPLGPVTVVHLLAVRGRTVLVVPDDEGYLLPATRVQGGDVAAAVAAVAGDLAPPGRGRGREGARQVGYLRRVRAGGSAAGVAEVVVLLDASAADLADQPVTWVPLGYAAALLPMTFATLVRVATGAATTETAPG
jgi:hypothetical protein